MQFLTAHLHTLRFDWAAIDTSLVLIALATATLLLQLQLRRWRRQSARALDRIFEQLDLMRLDVQEQSVVVAGAATRTPQAPASAPFSMSPAETVDYRTAARLAERGTSVREIAERCGLVSGEARVLVALQQARVQRAVNS
jgi:hypothetical protein